MHSVRRMYVPYTSVGQTHRRVGIGILRTALRLAERIECLMVARFQFADIVSCCFFGSVDSAREAVDAHRFGESDERVASDFRDGAILCEIGIEPVGIGTERMAERITGHLVGIAARFVVHPAQPVAP